jgi:hypothetical protein
MTNPSNYVAHSAGGDTLVDHHYHRRQPQPPPQPGATQRPPQARSIPQNGPEQLL